MWMPCWKSGERTAQHPASERRRRGGNCPPESEKAARRLPQLSKEAEQSVGQLKRASDYLAKKPELAKELSAAERRKRAQLQSKPVYKYVASSSVCSAWCLRPMASRASSTTPGNYGIYFALFGFAAIFLFSSYNMMPTAHNNHNAS